VTQVWWIADYAARGGLRYEPDADERWLRVWEPYATLKTPIRYEHALYLTGTIGSLTIARMCLAGPEPSVPGLAPVGPEAWVVIGQDERLTSGRAASVSDASGVFGEGLDLVPLPRRATGDAAFDNVFASFAETADDLAAITPSLRKLVLGWRVPLHFEIRKGGFVMAPVALRADASSLGWLVQAAQLFAEKAAKKA
jgi:hypothetical protein